MRGEVKIFPGAVLDGSSVSGDGIEIGGVTLTNSQVSAAELKDSDHVRITNGIPSKVKMSSVRREIKEDLTDKKVVFTNEGGMYVDDLPSRQQIEDARAKMRNNVDGLSGNQKGCSSSAKLCQMFRSYELYLIGNS